MNAVAASAMTQGRVAYRKVRILDAATKYDQVGDVLVDGTAIADFGADIFRAGIADDIVQVDCSGLCLTAGLVDMHCNLPGLEDTHKETFASAAKAAVAGGITTLACSADMKPVVDNVPVLESVVRAGREANLASVMSYAAITEGCLGENLTEMAMLNMAGCLGFTDGMQPLSTRMMLQAMKYVKLFNGLILHHPQEPSLFGKGVANQGARATRMGLTAVSPMAEVIMLERDLRLVEMTGTRYHACRISTAESVALMRAAKRKGLPVSCDTSPFHAVLTETEIEGYRTFAKLNPPLRTVADTQAIVSGLADGTIDAIASDHTPQDQDAKRLPFAQAAFGAVSFETMFSMGLELVEQGKLPMLTLLAALTCNPADILRLRVGRLAKGNMADMVVFDPNAQWTLSAESLQSKSKNTPCDNREMTGAIRITVKAGKIVHKLM